MTRFAAGALTLGLLLAAGCSSSSTAPISSAAYVDQVCALLMPCCAQGHLATDGAACHALLGAAAQAAGPAYDASAAATCLAGMRAAQGTQDLCTGTVVPTPGCDRVFPAAHGSTPPGAACTQTAECAVSAAGSTACLQSLDAGSTCAVVLAGQAGQGPCLESTSGPLAFNLWSSVDGPTPASGYACDRAAGLVCRTDRTCQPLVGLGGACVGDAECQEGLNCDLVSRTCTTRGGVGAPCLNDPACVDAAHCDGGAGTCQARVALGDACDAGQVCPMAAACTAGTCQASPDLGLVFLCGSAG